MCTVSIIPLVGEAAGYRLVTNRDEQRTRASAEPPAWRTFNGTRAIAPLDPAGGGTWVATSERGLTLCILNGNLRPAPAPPERARSRGEIIPALIGEGSVDAAMEALARMDLSVYPPFRLLGVEPGDGPIVSDAFWDRRELRRRSGMRAPACFVSSGLGDELVLPRLPLFDAMVGREGTAAAQDAFHRHVWPERPEISVCMSRAEARTVSVTTIEVRRSGTAARVEVGYEPVPNRG